MNHNLKRESRRLQLDFDVLKSGGFIKQTQEDLFTVRLRCPGGRVTSQQLHKAAEIAEKYGRGEIHNSFRQSIEVPYVHHQYFNTIDAELKSIGWSVASCGPRIRVPTACAGCTYNPNGLMDTQEACFAVDKKFFGTATTHHKFKMSFSGFGPTELRILLAIGTIALFRDPHVDLGILGRPRLFDFGGLIAIAAMAVALTVNVVRNATELARLEPRPDRSVRLQADFTRTRSVRLQPDLHP